jgi:hypothetical protein
MAACEALHGQPTATEGTMGFYGFHGILRATGLISANATTGYHSKQRRDGPAVKPQEYQQDMLKKIQINWSV